jgi:hypothetical protein
VTHREVRFTRTETSLDKIYGPSSEAVLLLPVGEKGEDILRRAKQTESERAECKKRGAE